MNRIGTIGFSFLLYILPMNNVGDLYDLSPISAGNIGEVVETPIISNKTVDSAVKAYKSNEFIDSELSESYRGDTLITTELSSFSRIEEYFLNDELVKRVIGTYEGKPFAEDNLRVRFTYFPLENKRSFERPSDQLSTLAYIK